MSRSARRLSSCIASIAIFGFGGAMCPSGQQTTPHDMGGVSTHGETTDKSDLTRDLSLKGESDSGLPKGAIGCIVDVKGYPTEVETYSDSFDERGLPRPESGLLANLHSRCASVLFVMRARSAGSDRVRGNGWLLDNHRVLTAAHVATMVRADPQAFAIRLMVNGYPRDLDYVDAKVLSEACDPDLGLVLVGPVADSLIGTAPLGVPRSRKLVLIGAAAFGDAPQVKTGWALLSKKRRALSKAWTQSVIGTNLPSFKGLSGSPVFDQETGDLIGVFSAGLAQFKNEYEAQVSAPSDSSKWDSWKDWSWVTPVADHIEALSPIK